VILRTPSYETKPAPIIAHDYLWHVEEMGPRLDDCASRSYTRDNPVMTSSSSLEVPSCTSRRRPRTTRTTDMHEDSPVVRRMEDGTLTSPFLSSIKTTYTTTPKGSIAYSRGGRLSLQQQQEQQQQSRTAFKSTVVVNEQESSPLLMQPHSSSLLENERQQLEQLVPPPRRRLFPGSSSSSFASSSTNQLSQQHHPPSPWLILAWFVHFISSILVLTYGTYANPGDR
jgi:hypothetical protein